MVHFLITCMPPAWAWVLEQSGFESGFATSRVSSGKRVHGFELPLPPSCMGLTGNFTCLEEEPTEEWSVWRVLLDVESNKQVPSELLHLIAVGHWVSQETFLSLNFVICKMGS